MPFTAKTSDNKPLSNRQLVFAMAYAAGANATTAAIHADYSEKSAAKQGNLLLKVPKVLAKIRQIQAEGLEHSAITTEKVVKEFARIAFADITDVISIDGDELTLKDIQSLPRDVTAAISEIWQSQNGAWRVKMNPKQPALDSLGKYLGMFVERSQTESFIHRDNLPQRHVTFQFVRPDPAMIVEAQAALPEGDDDASE